MTLSKGDIALSNAINQEMDRDSLFLEKCNYHNSLLRKFNKTGKSPMELSSTIEGQKQLDIINAKIGSAMIKKYGE